ncbi:MAG TPA: GAF domain-containing protein, partial [Flavobacteriales bacterium]|nr:GAF domain-containing protein [Flavobacteriales bacterium]
ISSQEIDALNEQAWSINRTDARKSFELAQQALKASEESNYTNGRTHAIAAIGASNVWMSNYDEALTYLFEARKLLKTEGNKIKEAQVVYQIFCCFFFLNDYDKAIEYAHEILQLATENRDDNAKANAYNGIGTIYYTIGESKKAIEFLLKGLAIASTLEDKHLLARILDGLGTSYHIEKNYEEAIQFKERSLAAGRSSGLKNVESYALNGLGLIYKDKGDLKMAGDMFIQSLGLRRDIEFKPGISETLYHLGTLCLELKQPEKALDYLTEGLEIANDIDYKEFKYKIHESLFKYYEGENDLENFKKHFLLFFSTKEDFTKEQHRQKLKSTEMQMRMTQMEKEKQSLEAKAKELEAYSRDLILLGNLGKKITSLLTVESINSTVYEILSTVMDVHGFGIGILTPDNKSLLFPGYIEEDEVHAETYDSLEDDDRIATYCFKNDAEILIGNFETEHTLYVKKRAKPDVGRDVSSLIYLPLKIEDRKIGVITVQSFTLNAYTDYHVNLIRNLGIYCAIAIENARSYEKLEEKVAERTQEVTKQKEELLKSYQTTHLLSEIGQQLTTLTSFKDIFLMLYKNVEKLMDAGSFGIRLYKPEKNVIEYRFEMEKGKMMEDKDAIEVSMDNDNNYSVWCAKNKEVIFINDNIAEHKKWVKQIHVVTGDMPHSLIFYPMLLGERLLGVITVQSFERNAYKEHHIDILKTLGTYTAIAFENASLIGNLEERVKERTEAVERAANNTKIIGEIGKEISATLDVSEIISKVYERVNTLMDASAFGIGLYRPEKNDLFHSGVMEKGQKLPDFSYNLDDERIACISFKQTKELVINNWEDEHRLYVNQAAEIVIGEDPVSMIYMPLVAKGKTIGVMSVQSFNEHAYQSYHVDILRSLALYVGNALDNAALYQTMEDRVKERTAEIEKAYENTRLLSQISKDISASLSIETIIEKVYTNVNALMDATMFGIGMYDEALGIIRFPGFIENKEKLPLIEFNINDDRLACWSIQNQKEIFVNDYYVEYVNYIKGIKQAPAGKQSASIIYVPLYLQGKITGLVTVQSYEKNAYTEYHLDIIRNLVQSIASALENARLYESMEENVKERTKEVVKQKEQIEKTFANTKIISEIGKEISATLSVEDIIAKVYTSVNTLMDATVFGLALYRPQTEDLFFTGAMERQEMLPDFAYPLKDERIATLCFKGVREIIINDWYAEYKNYVKEDYDATEGDMPESMIYLPILSKGKAIGVITVQSFERNAYGEYHTDIMRSLAIYIGSAIENANLYKGLEERVKERTAEIDKAYQNTRLLSQISKDISASLSIETIIEKVYTNVNTLMDATGFGIGIYEPETKRIRMPGYIERGVKMDDFSYRVDDDRLAPWCFRNQKEIFISNYSREYKNYIKGNIQAPVSGKDSTSIIYLPLFLKDKITGVLTVQSFAEAVYTEYHLDILRSLATSIASALENARLYESMEEKVRERTQEVVKQKEQIEKTFANTKIISEIGKEISATLSVRQIISKVYQNVNNLMDATVFGIGLLRPLEGDLFFSGVMEKGEQLEDYKYKLSDDKIATRCFNRNEEIVINDWEKEFRKYVAKDYDAAQGDMPESMIYMPVFSKDKLIGVMTVQSFSKHAYSEYHTDIMRSLTVYVGSAIENANLYEGLEERVQERTAEIDKAYQDTKLLAQISKEISASLSVETIVEAVYTHVNSLMDAASFGIGIYNAEDNRLHFPGFLEDGARLENVSFDVNDDRVACWCYKNKEEVFTNNYVKDYHKYVKELKQVIAGKRSLSIIYIPLFSKEKLIGVITIQSYHENAYTEYHMDILRNLSHSIATAMENAVLYANMEEKVNERTAEVVKQKEIIEEKNKHITDSIIYAKRIQQAILPAEEVFSNYLHNSFVLYKPKDIVSGDFYWIERKGNKILFAVVDCTGHGVPGAFMSIIGFNSLNQVVNELNITNPAEILNNLNKIVTYTLRQKQEDTKIQDGMDLSICVVDLEKNKLEFAGANNPIFIVRNGNVIEVVADHHPIGNYVGENDFRFKNNEIDLFPNDRIYLSSDGYADQFGGPRGKKLKYTQFRDILLENHNLPMKEQKAKLDKMFEEWRGDLEQIDDVCVIGVGI